MENDIHQRGDAAGADPPSLPEGKEDMDGIVGPRTRFKKRVSHSLDELLD
jgi:hypothetical protein